MANKLAIEGGAPVISQLPRNPWPIITAEDISAVMKVLESGTLWGIHHPEVTAFEEEFARYCGAAYCLAVDSGTAALHMAVAAAGVRAGDEVITTAFSFLASASSILHHNGIPVFVDIDPRTFNLDASLIEERITDRTRAILPVHLHGLPADMDEINAIARKRSLAVIEDAAQAHGAQYKGKKTGALADIAAFSIMPGKNLPAAGEGGLLTTDNLDYRDKADMVRMFGEIIRKDEKRAYRAYTMGWNYRPNVMAMAFARSQLKRLDEYTAIRQSYGNYLTAALGKIPGVVPPLVPQGRTHVYHIYRIRFEPGQLGLDMEPGRFRVAVQDMLNAEGVPLHEYLNIPIPGQPVFQNGEGYGRGCPWECRYGRKPDYDIKQYPETLRVIEDSVIIGWFGNPQDKLSLLDLYIEAFNKVFGDVDGIVRYAARMGEYVPAWAKDPRLF